MTENVTSLFLANFIGREKANCNQFYTVIVTTHIMLKTRNSNIIHSVNPQLR